MRPSEFQTTPEPFPLLERTLTTDFDTLFTTFSISSDNDTDALIIWNRGISNVLKYNMIMSCL